LLTKKIFFSWTKDGTKSRSLTATDHSSRGQGEGDDESIHDEVFFLKNDFIFLCFLVTPKHGRE